MSAWIYTSVQILQKFVDVHKNQSDGQNCV